MNPPTKLTYKWNLRGLMAQRDMYQTTDLHRSLQEYGVSISREQTYRLVTHPPERLNIQVLAALCAILDCTPNDLITFVPIEARRPSAVNESGTAVPASPPVRANIRRPHGTD